MDNVVLTSENAEAFYAHKMNPMPEPAAAPDPKPEAAKGEGEPAVESAKESSAEASDEADDKQIPNPEARHKVNVRFSELTEARKAAEAKAIQAEADAKAAHDARVLAEQRAAELQAKYEPPKPDELGPEPQRSQFVNDEEYIASVKDYAAAEALRERDHQEREATRAASWEKRAAEARAAIPDFDATIKASANLMVSNDVRDAILDSEVGPQLQHHLAANPALVSELSRMKLGPAMLMIGRLEAKFLAGKPAVTSPEPGKEPPKPVVAASEPSRAPAPISPLKGASAPVDLPMQDGVWHGTHAQYKAARKAGKI